MLTVTGKKVRYAAITAFDTHEVPSQTTTIGAIAQDRHGLGHHHVREQASLEQPEAR